MRYDNRFGRFLIASLFGLTLLFGGCAKTWQKVDADGSFFGSTNGNYVVVKYSGGRIVDVWKLEDVIVQSEEHSDGWLFLDAAHNPVHIGGDMKSTRFTTKTPEWVKAHDWHLDRDGGEYSPLKDQ